MKTTHGRLAGMVLVLTLGAPVARGDVGAVIGTWAAKAALAQAEESADLTADEQATRLLLRARKAMADGDLETADSLISRAEGLGVRYGVLHVGDTPKKARRDLLRAKKSAARNAASAAPREEASEEPSRAPAEGEALTADEFDPEQQSPEPAAPSRSPKATAARYVAKGRAELERSNLAAAAHWYREAARLEASFDAEEDSPEKLRADIEQAGGKVASAPSGTTDNPFARGRREAPPSDEELSPAAAVLGRRNDELAIPLDGVPGALAPPPAEPIAGAGAEGKPQSDALLRRARLALAAGDMKTAVESVTAAQALGMQYGLDEDSPELVAGAIRSQEQWAQMQAAGREDAALAKLRAQQLLEQADWLVRWKAWDEAQRLARSAAELQVSFGPFDSTPDQVLARIAQARAGGVPAAGAASTTEEDAKAHAVALIAEAQHALARRDLESAEQFAVQANQLGLPDEAYQPGELRPETILQAVARAKAMRHSPNRRAVHAPETDVTQNQQVNAEEEATHDSRELAPGSPTLGSIEEAPTLTTDANASAGEPTTDGSAAVAEPEQIGAPAAEAAPPGSLLTRATAEQQVLARQLQSEIITAETSARATAETDPQGAMNSLTELKTRVEKSALDEPTRQAMLRHIARTTAELARYIEQNKSRIDLNARNRQIVEDVERSREMKVEVDSRMAKLVDDFNQLMDEQRFAEAELLAQRAEEIDPENTIVKQLKWQSRFVRRYQDSLRIQDGKEKGVVDALASVDEASTPIDDRRPFTYDLKRWEDAKKRKSFREGERPLRTEKEREIESKLKTPVSLQFENRPLGEVIDYLAKLAGINILLDPAGLAEEGVTSDQPVTINLIEEIQLRSALKVILEQLRLDYVIEDEMLKITSEQFRSGKTYPQTYYVADLVTPIPNFVPNASMGLGGALREGYNTSWYNQGAMSGSSPTAVLASRNGAPNSAVINPDVLANVNSAGGLPGASADPNQPMGFGPGGLGGGAFADFDSLIELITTTVEPDSWEEVGGAGTISEYRTNLSLVISQTQEVHEQIVELLEQLRRLHDLQVTIEVRFITLNDNFFERIGVDFDFDINDNADRPFQIFGRPTGQVANNIAVRDTQDRDLRRGEGATVGLQPTGLFSTDLDIPFKQGSFNLAVPQFGGFDPTAGVQMGFAILSDLEAFFLVNAAQGDRRSNVLQAPKVTLFNGQQASVADVSQSPFVISVIPVVGDFAAAQQPVIVVLNEGTFLTVQAVVSSDRRYVRLTVVPFFSNIGEVNTFTFSGSSTTVENASSSGPTDATTQRANNRTTTSEGTTVQLPTFSLVTVSTTVSVPDGGTVLLGGIKRLSEGRNEFGVPMLNKLPYINRLFKNVGIGRETQSLMMMVTPRIIIQEEEEEALLGTPVTP